MASGDTTQKKKQVPERPHLDRLARRAAARRVSEPEVWELRGRAFTDLVVEAQQMLVSQPGAMAGMPGVHTETRRHDAATVTRMAIESPEAGRALGKVPGYYSTIESEGLRERNEEVQEQITEVFAQELGQFLQRLGIGPEDPVLVIGLGNWNSTPDSLGPKTVSQLLVTRHLHEMVPPEARGGLRPLAALSPGVLGITGIETAEIISGVVHRIHPALVVCIDALAARSTSRLGTTIQMSDTGIHPGSGVGNKRFGITRETLGVPVLAIGVPTVIQAATIISDGMEMLAGQDGNRPSPAQPGSVAMQPDPSLMMHGSGASGSGVRMSGQGASGAGFGPPAPSGGPLGQPGQGQPVPAPPRGIGGIGTVPGGEGGGAPFGPSAVGQPTMNPQQKMQAMRQLLAPFMGDLIVTPKDIDVLVEDIAQTMAAGINAAFHPSLDLSNVLRYLQ